MDLRKLCRICFVGDTTVDIRKHKTYVWPLDATTTDVEEEHTILEIMHAMFDSSAHISLDLTTELPMICNACLEECLLHYSYFSKLVIANRQLRQLYNEAQPAVPELYECEDEDSIDEALQMFEPEPAFIVDAQVEEQQVDKATSFVPVRPPQKLANEDSLIVSEFLPATQLDERSDLAQFPPYELRTVDYAAVELKHNNLDEYNEANRLLDAEPSGSQAVYKCKYCPLAYTSQQFLKTHVRKSHVCKYCTTAFVKVKDLNAHIRSRHSSHQCVVCANSFSTSSNLRAHLKRVHGVQLPKLVELLDYRPASEAAVATAPDENYILELD